MSVLYPVATSAEAALRAPSGFAAREREARALSGGEAVVFVTELAGPAFDSAEAAVDAYPGRLDDERPGRAVRVPPEQRWCSLTPVAREAGGRRRRTAVEPVNKDGRRWPAPDSKAAGPQWRLSVSYWRIGGVAATEPKGAARELRRKAEGQGLDPGALQALARQPLQAVRPQQPLDIGLFETRLPEAPDVIVPDE
jgi:hypothetical protein